MKAEKSAQMPEIRGAAVLRFLASCFLLSHLVKSASYALGNLSRHDKLFANSVQCDDEEKGTVLNISWQVRSALARKLSD